MVRQDEREDIAAERRAIRVVLRLIDLELARSGRSPAESRDVWIRLIGFLHAHLKRHFELEERGGVLGEFEAVDEGTYRHAREFTTQHRRFIRSLECLLDTLEADRIDGARVPDYFEPELRSLFADLDRHEARELELTQALASRDIGCGD